MNFSMFLEQHSNFDFTNYIVDAIRPSDEGRFGFNLKLSNIDDDITEHKKYIKAIDNIFKKVLKL